MSLQSGSSLRTLVLTPDRMPTFFIPSRSPLLCVSPRPCRLSDRTRLLSDPEDDSPGPSSPASPARPAAAASPSFLLRLPPRVGRLCRSARAANAATSAEPDTDVTTRAAMSLQHVAKVTTPYGFRAVLAASPCTRRRESLFHRNKPVTVTVTDADPVTGPSPAPSPAPSPSPRPGPVPGRSRVGLRPVRGLGLQVLKELKALSPRRPAPR